jgi:hypothetical protein
MFFINFFSCERFAGRVRDVESIAPITLHLMMYHTSLGKPSELQEIRCKEYHQHHHLNSSFFFKVLIVGRFAGRVREVESIALLTLRLMMYHTSPGKLSGLQEIRCNE